MALLSSDEVSVADWIVNSLYPFTSYLAGSIVPPGYEAYARILHPAQNSRGENVARWSEIAQWAERVYHPAMQFESIATPVTGSGIGHKPWDGRVPYQLPLWQAGVLAKILRNFTSTPEKIWYCVWEGYGGLLSTEMASTQRVHCPQRDYLMYTGCLDCVANFHIGESQRQTPDYWFPNDRSWCVATDVDLYWTYVGGSKSCIESILQNHQLESVLAELTHGLTVDGDSVNLLSDEEKSIWGAT